MAQKGKPWHQRVKRTFVRMLGTGKVGQAYDRWRHRRNARKPITTEELNKLFPSFHEQLTQVHERAATLEKAHHDVQKMKQKVYEELQYIAVIRACEAAGINEFEKIRGIEALFENYRKEMAKARSPADTDHIARKYTAEMNHLLGKKAKPFRLSYNLTKKIGRNWIGSDGKSH